MDNSIIRQAGFSIIPQLPDLWENPAMSRDLAQTKQTLRERVRERLELTGKSALGVSKEIGANTGYVRDLLDPAKTSIPSAARLARIAQALGTTTDWLIGTADSPEQPHSEVSFREPPNLWNGPQTAGIPLLGTAYCDDLAVETVDGNGEMKIERVLLEQDHTVRMIMRPPALWAAKDAYAIYFHGSSMEPRFRQGDIGVVDPRRPPRPGEDVVAQLNDGNGGQDVITVLVKELGRTTSDHVELTQFNPPITFKVPRRQIARLHRIVSLAELLGA